MNKVVWGENLPEICYVACFKNAPICTTANVLCTNHAGALQTILVPRKEQYPHINQTSASSANCNRLTDIWTDVQSKDPFTPVNSKKRIYVTTVFYSFIFNFRKNKICNKKHATIRHFIVKVLQNCELKWQPCDYSFRWNPRLRNVDNMY